VKTEAQLQAYFRKKCQANLILWRKLKFEGRRGAPDILIAKYGRAVFVELKSPSGKGVLSELQKREHRKMRAVELYVVVLSSKEEVDRLISIMLRSPEDIDSLIFPMLSKP
jgi:hypothetical protein